MWFIWLLRRSSGCIVEVECGFRLRIMHAEGENDVLSEILFIGLQIERAKYLYARASTGEDCAWLKHC